MFNNTGIKKETAGAPKQILWNVQYQLSISVVVDASAGQMVDGRKIVKAGMPLYGMYGYTQPYTLADGDTKAAVGYLLHDVDVTDGNANGSLLIFGFIDKSKLDADVIAKIKEVGTTGEKGSTRGPFVEFLGTEVQ